MFLLDGRPLQVDMPFTHNGIQYPANWLRLSTWEEKSAIGITEVSEPSRPDDRFYYISMQGDPVAKDLDVLKNTFKQQINRDAYTILLNTDWYVIRKQEANIAIPESIASHRANVRFAIEYNKMSIESANTLDELIVVVNNIPSSWPHLDIK